MVLPSKTNPVHRPVYHPTTPHKPVHTPIHKPASHPPHKPSHPTSTTPKKPVPPQSKLRDFFYKQWKKYRIKILVLIILILSWFIFRALILEFIQQYPLLWGAYSHVQTQIISKTLLGLFYYSFLSSLFFIFLPIELIFLFYSTLDHPTYAVVLIVIIGNLFGLIFNYITGRILGKSILRYFMKNKFETFHKLVLKYGGLILFLGNVVIFPIEPASLVYGAARYPFRKFLWYSLSGKILKFLLLIFGKTYLVARFFG